MIIPRPEPGEILPVGWAELKLLPALQELGPEPEELLGLDDELMRQARARESDDDIDEWRRAVAFVRRKIGEGIELAPGARSDLLPGGKGLDGAIHKKRSEYALVAEPPLEPFLTWARADPRWSALVRRARAWRREHTPAKHDVDLPDAEAGNGGIRLLHGDFRDRLLELQPGSVDLIVTDPPYPKEDLTLWRDLGVVALDLLAPRGLLFAWTGQIFLPDVVGMLGETLTYGWTFSLLLPGSGSRIMGRHIVQAWKPVLAFSTGTWPSGEWGDDLLLSPKRDKGDYAWQQHAAPARRLIERYSAPDGLVVDPFLGVGSFGCAARDAGRRFVGVELDASRFRKAECNIIEGDG